MTTERIDIDPAIMMGKPVIRGTRITVELILRKLAEGASEDELLNDYPLTSGDIRAAMGLRCSQRGARGSDSAPKRAAGEQIVGHELRG